METISVNEARNRLDSLIDEVARLHEPIQILGKCSNAVLISEGDWRAIQESIYLLSIPGMRESIREGLDTPLDKTDDELD